MNSVKTLRKNLGLSQPAFALLLGVTRSAVAMAESGERRLNKPAQERLQMLTLHSQDPLPERQAILSAVAEETLRMRRELTTQLKKKRIRIAQLAQELETMQATHEAALRALALIEDDRRVLYAIPYYIVPLNERYEEQMRILLRSLPCHQAMMRAKVRELEAWCEQISIELNAL